jgi:hypothetical protein
MLIWLYNVLDKQYVYGSATNSTYPNESLNLLLKDKKTNLTIVIEKDLVECVEPKPNQRNSE